MACRLRRSTLFATLVLLGGCSDEPPPDPARECDAACRDSVTLRAFREVLKVAYNLTLQGNPVGAQDESLACPLGGSVRLFGEATSNASQGTTSVDLTYQLDTCRYLQRDEEPPENYDVRVTGEVTQQGVFAVQPNENTALTMRSSSVSIVGSVYDPPLAVEETDCAVELGQNGDHLGGEFCGRIVAVDFDQDF